MKEVKMFQADDGALFKTQQDALDRDNLIKEIDRLNSLLGGKLDLGSEFYSGGGYYQLTKAMVDNFDYQFLEVVKRHEPWIFKEYLDNPTWNKGNKYTNEQIMKSHILARGLSDSGSILYESLIIRLSIDNQFRRWGLPYFANNPNVGKQVKLGGEE